MQNSKQKAIMFFNDKLLLYIHIVSIYLLFIKSHNFAVCEEYFFLLLFDMRISLPPPNFLQKIKKKNSRLTREYAW